MELSIALEKACYFPGEVLKCLIKVRRLGDAAGLGAADGLQLFFECSGSERVDPSWVSHLYHPEVTAQKDNKRLVRSIFSTGQVPLLEGAHNQALGAGREFIVRCRLPNRLPPSYRGNAVRFVYQVVVRGRLVALPAGAKAGAAAQPAAQAAGAAVAQQAAAAAVASCQAHSSFVVWPVPERSAIERRASIPAPLQSAGGSTAGAAAAAAAAAAGMSSLADGLQDVELLEYRLGMTPLRLRWEEVILHADGTRTLLAHQPTAQLYPSASAAAQLLGAAQLCALDALQLEEAAPGAGPGGLGAGDDADGGDGGGGPPRQLTPAQRASMAARTYNLRAGDHPLLRLVLQPPSDTLLQPGGTFGLLLDFRASQGALLAPGDAAAAASQQPVCLQVVALLESEEVVLPPYAPPRSGPEGTTAMRRLHSEQTELTAHLLTTHLTFSIPLTAPPSFKTPMVCHKWVLRFELTLGRRRSAKAGAALATEQLLWSLPLVVYPPPAQAATAL